MKKITFFVSKIIDLLVLFLKGGVALARRKGVKVGQNCRIYISSWGSEPFLIQIGNSVTITSGVKLLTHDGSTCLVLDENGSRYQRYGAIVICDNVFVGVNSIILPGITIGSNSVVGAGSLVTKNVPPNSVVVGSPARVVSSFDEFSKKISISCASNTELAHVASYEDRVKYAIALQEKLKK